MPEEFVLFSGTANLVRSEAIAAELGVPLAAAQVERFPDGEVSVRLGGRCGGRTSF
jgi:phosphoribosylpyrophosphate synthetase